MDEQTITRQQRRALRLQRVVEDRDAHRAALRAGLDYRVSGETGALVVHTHSLSYHRAKTPNITIPPVGRGWDKSGRARVVEGPQTRITMVFIQDQDGNPIAAAIATDPTE